METIGERPIVFIALYNNNNNNNNIFISYINIQVSHHLQIARLIEAGGVRTA